VKLPVFRRSNYEWFYFLTLAYANGILQVAEKHLKTWQGTLVSKASDSQEVLFGTCTAAKT